MCALGTAITERNSRSNFSNWSKACTLGGDVQGGVEEWRAQVPREAIAEAVRVASQAFFDHSGQYAKAEYSLESAPA
jgi:hypothetical protein